MFASSTIVLFGSAISLWRVYLSKALVTFHGDDKSFDTAAFLTPHKCSRVNFQTGQHWAGGNRRAAVRLDLKPKLQDARLENKFASLLLHVDMNDDDAWSPFQPENKHCLCPTVPCTRYASLIVTCHSCQPVGAVVFWLLNWNRHPGLDGLPLQPVSHTPV